MPVACRGLPEPPYRSATISAAIDRAVSAGVRAPKSRPMGNTARRVQIAVAPASRSRIRRSRWVRCEPIAPTYPTRSRSALSSRGMLNFASWVSTQIAVWPSACPASASQSRHRCGHSTTASSASGSRRRVVTTGRASQTARGSPGMLRLEPTHRRGRSHRRSSFGGCHDALHQYGERPPVPAAIRPDGRGRGAARGKQGRSLGHESMLLRALSACAQEGAIRPHQDGTPSESAGRRPPGHRRRLRGGRGSQPSTNSGSPAGSTRWTNTSISPPQLSPAAKRSVPAMPDGGRTAARRRTALWTAPSRSLRTRCRPPHRRGSRRARHRACGEHCHR